MAGSNGGGSRRGPRAGRPRRRSLLHPALLAAALTAAPAAAEDGFSTANVQLLQGWSFQDPAAGLVTDEGSVTTLTFNHYAQWAHGDSLFFADLYRGAFVDPAGEPTNAPARLYAEWQPRLLFGRMLGRERYLGVLSNFGLAAEYNQSGDGFYAYLVGLGLDFALPPPFVAGVNAYYRYDRFVGSTWQVTLFWTIPLATGKVPLLFAGFADLSGTEDLSGETGLDLLTQPQLLIDVLGLLGGPKGDLLLGAELFVHVRPERTQVVPQAMVQWTIR